MQILFVSLGCDKNLVDTEMMLGQLAEKGYTFTDDEAEADIAVVNSCCFIGDAKEESINTILEKGNDSCHSLLVFLSFRPLQVQSLLLRGITLPRQWKAACCRPDHQSVVLLRQ